MIGVGKSRQPRELQLDLCGSHHEPGKDCGEELRQARVLINSYVVAEGFAEWAAKAHVQATPFRFEEGL